MTAKFITLEGLEGVGKSTNMAFIEQFLSNRGISLDITREPGGTPLAEAIRKLVLDTDDEPVPDMCELFLIFAARCAHIENRIRGSLDRGTWVLCDRFTDATYAYQGGGRGLPIELIASLEHMIQGGLQPDLTILLDAPAEIGLGRISDRPGHDRFETQQLDFFENARNVYLERARHDPERCVIVDASRPLAQVQDELRQILELFLSVN